MREKLSTHGTSLGVSENGSTIRLLVGKTLVTGGTGFLGTHVVRALAERGDQLRLLVRRGSQLDHLSGFELNAPVATSPTGGRCARRWRASTACSISRGRRQCGPTTATVSSS